MASIISAGTTSGTSLNLSGDTSGVLQLASNGSTTAVTIDTSQNVGIGTASPSSYGKFAVVGGQMGIDGGSDARLYMYNGSTQYALLYASSVRTQLEALQSTPLTFWTAAAERMRIDSSGRVTMPYQPAFRAFRSSSVSVATSGVVVFDSTSTNIGSNYNTSNGRFTAPVAGMYQFNMQVLLESLSNGNQCECSMFLNGGGTYNFGPRVKYQADYTGWDGYVSLIGTISIYLNASDYVQVSQQSGGTRTIYGNAGGVWSTFSGFLIG